MPNPISVAYQCQFRLDTPIDSSKRRHTGTCVCGIRGSVSYDSFCKKKFCRNEDCEYYQAGKRLDMEEMRIIAEERKCEYIELSGKGSKATITFTCSCGLHQSDQWIYFYRDRWCRYYACEHYHKPKYFDTNLIKDWLVMEGYEPPDGFEYTDYSTRMNLTCPHGHSFSCSAQMWTDNARCKVCHGDGRTLGYQDIKDFYTKHGCEILYTEDDFTANVTDCIVPYVCPEGHTIDNMTKNNFNTRIQSGIGPCAVCREAQRDRKKEAQKRLKTVRKRYGVDNVIQIPEVAAKMMASSHTFKLYTLPSGKQVELQGYEPRCMDMLLEEYTEDQVLSDLEDMPEIWYFNPIKKLRARYFPDMYIPHENKVIEVKSTWTLQIEYERNLAKFKGAVDAGYELHLYVFDEKDLLYTKIYTKDRTVVCPYPPANIVIVDDSDDEE